MSMLAGDIYGKTPIWGPIRILKGVYYAISLRHLRRTVDGWQRRRQIIRDMDMSNRETNLKAN